MNVLVSCPKYRRHHNNTGYRQIKEGKTREQVAQMAKRILHGTPPKKAMPQA